MTQTRAPASESTGEEVDRGRRWFLRSAAVTGALVSFGVQAAPARGVRELGFLNLHTGERLKVPYWENGKYIRAALTEINHVLRDHRANTMHAIDTGLLDLLYRLKAAVGNDRPFEVISGYRSPASNEMLRLTGGGGVAKMSLHMVGKAIDIRHPGTDLLKLHAAAKSLKGGGVGLYRNSNFIHVDTGRVRYW